MNDDLAISLEPLHSDAYGWALHCCVGSEVDAGDVLQTAYVKVLQKKAVWSERASLKTWWFGVIRYTAKEEARRRLFRESLPAKILKFAPVVSESNRKSHLELDEEAAHLKRCLLELPQRQAEVLHLVFYQNLTLSEAAIVMKVSVGTARTHYHRAKSRLREKLKPKLY